MEPENILSKLRIVIHDTKLIFSKLPNLVRYARDIDSISSSISIFSAETNKVKFGEIQKYHLIILNNTNTNEFYKLVIDIYFKDNPVHPQGHYTFFEKNILLPPKSNEAIKLYFNWNQTAVFIVQDVPLVPDSFWRGDCKLPGRYYVRALLYNTKHDLVEELFLVQELSL
jgi:hypothetical protein